MMTTARRFIHSPISSWCDARVAIHARRLFATVNTLDGHSENSHALTACFLKERRLSGWSPNEPYDWYFHLPLWLQTPCCGHVLWAFNIEHLTFLESYIEADHRTALPEEVAQRLRIRNATLASRLPKWTIVAKHRSEVLKCIRKLRDDLTE
ncbi:MAG TPA: hypothetical protein VF175_17180 [Lacipirellula sp.]